VAFGNTYQKNIDFLSLQYWEHVEVPKTRINYVALRRNSISTYVDLVLENPCFYMVPFCHINQKKIDFFSLQYWEHVEVPKTCRSYVALRRNSISTYIDLVLEIPCFYMVPFCHINQKNIDFFSYKYWDHVEVPKTRNSYVAILRSTKNR